MKKWLIVTIMVFLAVCGQAQTKKGPVKKTISKTTSGSSQVGSVARGKILYETHCRTCHQADGGGVPNMNPPLINTSYVLGSKSKLI
jgi:cytochrome c5